MVEHPLGKGEVECSIHSGSTINPVNHGRHSKRNPLRLRDLTFIMPGAARDDVCPYILQQCRLQARLPKKMLPVVQDLRMSAPECYSITSSARVSNDGGTVRPSALAARKLMASSYLVGA